MPMEIHHGVAVVFVVLMSEVARRLVILALLERKTIRLLFGMNTLVQSEVRSMVGGLIIATITLVGMAETGPTRKILTSLSRMIRTFG